MTRAKSDSYVPQREANKSENSANLHRVLRVGLPAVEEMLQVQHHLLPGAFEVCHTFPDHRQVLFARYLVVGENNPRGEHIKLAFGSRQTIDLAPRRSLKGRGKPDARRT